LMSTSLACDFNRRWSFWHVFVGLTCSRSFLAMIDNNRWCLFCSPPTLMPSPHSTSSPAMIDEDRWCLLRSPATLIAADDWWWLLILVGAHRSATLSPVMINDERSRVNVDRRPLIHCHVLETIVCAIHRLS
jgi:hypothetical protein